MVGVKVGVTAQPQVALLGGQLYSLDIASGQPEQRGAPSPINDSRGPQGPV
jgi:hypothetical protein